MKVAFFIDAANMFHAQKPQHIGFYIDFKKLRNHLLGQDSLYRAIYYVGERVPPEAKDQRFLDALRHLGFKIHRKSLRKYIDQETGDEIEKGNLDIEIAVDMLMQQERYNRAFLLSGDGDFTRVVKFLMDRGKSIIVVSTWSMLNTDLYDASSDFIELKDLREYIERKRS